MSIFALLGGVALATFFVLALYQRHQRLLVPLPATGGRQGVIVIEEFHDRTQNVRWLEFVYVQTDLFSVCIRSAKIHVSIVPLDSPLPTVHAVLTQVYPDEFDTEQLYYYTNQVSLSHPFSLTLSLSPLLRGGLVAHWEQGHPSTTTPWPSSTLILAGLLWGSLLLASVALMGYTSQAYVLATLATIVLLLAVWWSAWRRQARVLWQALSAERAARSSQNHPDRSSK